LERQLGALREWVRKTFGGVGVIEEGYRFRIERGWRRLKKLQQLLDFALTPRLHLTRNPISAVPVLYHDHRVP
jgi:hypothetical protein